MKKGKQLKINFDNIPNYGLIVDNFAGGGGASTGIELALGRHVDIAINHDPQAIAMHKVNHPKTKHYCENVWDIDPVKVCNGRPIDLAWFSPDCKHFSKAKGGKPVDKNIRGLAWVVLRWAATVKPKVIMLENVEEFKTWGPVRKGKPVKTRRGETFEKWKSQLEALGYDVDYRELVACDYGAPTKRKRFFLIARCDGKSIKWPEPTHADRNSDEAKIGLLKSYVSAGDIIDWSVPCKSIFDRKKPLTENTLKRIARGIQKFVIEDLEPFIVPIGYGENKKQEPRVHDIKDPLPTIVSSGKHYLCMPFITRYNTENTKNGVRGQSLVDHNAICAAHIIQMNNNSFGHRMDEPLNTIVAGPTKLGVVKTFLRKYCGSENKGIVEINREQYQIVDIGLRMLTPRELYRAQGFPEDYVIDRGIDNKPFTKTQQVKMVGNSVAPALPTALVKANLPEQCPNEEITLMSDLFAHQENAYMSMINI
jgi:DNA (cytosine-5)-methyltransferase 1